MLSFVVVLLHLNPDILERYITDFLLPVVMIQYSAFSVYRLQSEVDEVLGNKETVSAEDLEKLQYTEQVLNYRKCMDIQSF